MTYYAYVHAKPNTVSAEGIFYVGKGKRSRASFLKARNPHHGCVVRKYGVENILVGKIECSSSEIAYELEVGLIKCLKRSGATLTNMTNGGEGGAGLKLTPEQIKKRTDKIRGRVCINKNDKERHVPPELVDSFVATGWKVGRSESVILAQSKRMAGRRVGGRVAKPKEPKVNSNRSCAGTVWVTNGKEQKRVNACELNTLTENGWKPGRLPLTNETKQKIGNAARGKKHSEVSRRKMSNIFRGEPHPLSGTKRTDEQRRRHREAILGRRFVNNGLSVRMVDADTAASLVAQGWSYGKEVR